MGLFKGKRRKGLLLTMKKNYIKYKCKRSENETLHNTSDLDKQFKNVTTSTPNKQKRKRTAANSNKIKSPLHKKCKVLSPIVHWFNATKHPHNTPRKCIDFKCENELSISRDSINSVEHDSDVFEETFLYSEENTKISSEFEPCSTSVTASIKGNVFHSGLLNDTLNKDSTASCASDSRKNMTVDTEDETLKNLFTDAMKILKENNLDIEIVTFLKLVSLRKFPLDNVAFQLFLDVVKWFDSEDVRSVRYNDTSMKFFWLGKRLFGGRFLRFMGGPKNETCLLQGNTRLSPSSSKINFACPSNAVLSQFNPLGFELSFENGPGLIESMIDLVAENNNEQVSYVLMFDGKKIKRGADMDLLGFEKEPASERKLKFDADMQEVSNALKKAKYLDVLKENGQTIDRNLTAELFHELLTCFKIFSRYLMELRQMRKTKEMAMSKYKERILKDPALAKSLEYAMDSCRTASYLIDKSVSSLLDVQFVLCNTRAYINGCLTFFPRQRGEEINISKQPNVKLLHDDNIDSLPTELVKQRTERWYNDRQQMKITGSTKYSAIGCDGLKCLHSHFDSVVSGVHKDTPNESQRKAMEHGTESEVHEIATLSGIIMPFLFPDMVYCEEGYYIENNMLVSADGSLRDKSGSKMYFAFEGKAPCNEINMKCLQYYSVPVRYIPQTLFESKFMNSEKGTIYLCWTHDSTTLFRVPGSESVCSSVDNIIKDVYTDEVPKRPTRIPSAIKKLKEDMKYHATQCEFLGEFPSLYGINIEDTTTDEANNSSMYSYQELTRALLKAIQTLKDVYSLRRVYASQVLVYLLADLDRLWKPEMPHAVPVMFCYRGYSFPMDVARKLLEHSIKACVQIGLHVAVVSSDGEFIPLMVQDKSGQPLTKHQLSKRVWSEVCKMKKNEIIKELKSINKTHRTYSDSIGKVSLESTDGGFNIRTPTHGWKKKITSKAKVNDILEHETTESVNTDVPCHPHVQSGTNYNLNDDRLDSATSTDHDLNETISYDFEELLQEQEHEKPQESVLSIQEAQDICYLLNKRKPSKWKEITPEEMINKLLTKPKTLLKDELLDVSKYLNLKLIGTEKELKVKNVTKHVLLQQLANLLGSRVEQTQPKIQKRVKQPKTLQVLATSVLSKPSFPKQVLNISYSAYVWPNKVKEWQANGKTAERVKVFGEREEDDVFFEPYYIPEFDEDSNEFRIFTYDKTHLGTNLRKAICLDRVKGISLKAWKYVSMKNPDILHPSIIEVTEGKILDQMKEKLSRNMMSKAVEEEMSAGGFTEEAVFCKVIREGLYEADDMPGIPAFERCKRRLALIKWLDKEVNFGNFPPYGSYILGMSHILYEGLRASQEGKMYLYALANSRTYCVRAPNTLCSESFFGSMQETDPWGQGILSASGVQKHLADFTTITAMKMDDTRNIHIKTKSDTAYPNPTVQKPEDAKGQVSMQRNIVCECRKNKFIQCIIPRNHFFDTAARARVQKKEQIYKPSTSGTFRGEQPIRAQYGYKINEARMLPSKRMAIESLTDNDIL